MALSDLLWACPECGEDRGLEPAGKGMRCRRCGARFERRRGSTIRCTRTDGVVVEDSPAGWLDRLPAPASLLRRSGDGPVREARVAYASVTGAEAVHDREGYLNRIERYGEEAPARLVLEADALRLEPEGGAAETWPLEDLTAVQGSSHSLQLNVRGRPLVSLRFPDDSIFLWERLLRAALRDFYGRTGRGEIVEFQPRIVTA